MEEVVSKETVQDASYQDGSFFAEFGYLENQRTGVSDGKLLVAAMCAGDVGRSIPQDFVGKV